MINVFSLVLFPRDCVKKTNMSTRSGFKQFLVAVTMSPSTLNTRSLGTDVAAICSRLLAIPE